MKRFSIIIVVILLSSIVYAQSPFAFKYQAVARDLTGELLSNHNIGLKVSILQGNPSGVLVYSESHLTTTNQFGLFTVEIGNGTVLSGSFISIDWGSYSHFLKLEIDTAGGTNFQILGTSQLQSVPYALYAQSTGDTTTWQKNGNNIHYGNGNVGIGVSNPAYKLDVDGIIATAAGNSNNWNSAYGWGDHSLAGYLSTESDPVFSSHVASTIAQSSITKWDMAYGWGDHSLAGYLTSETDPIFAIHVASGITSADISSWNTAYGWGDHSLAGYLNSETDPIFGLHVASGITSTDISNWNTAYSWGDHSQAGYITNETDPQVGSNVLNYLSKWNGSALVASSVYENNGKVGIGLSNPTDLVHVKGSVFPYFKSEAITDTDAGLHLQANSVSAEPGGKNQYALLISGTDNSGDFHINEDYINGNWAPVTRFAIENETGNIGIGTIYPDYNLHIHGSGNFTGIRITDQNTLVNGGEIGIQGDKSVYFWNYENSYLLFGTNNSEKMRINSSGNMGIGTINPQEKLHVIGSIRMVDGNQGAGKVMISDLDGTASWQDAATLDDGDWTQSGNYLTTMDSVGIGTTTPEKKLDVAGEAQFDGALYARDATGIGFKDDSGYLGLWVRDNGNVGVGGNPYWYQVSPSLPGSGPDLHVNTGQETASVWIGGNMTTTGSEVGHLAFSGFTTNMLPVGAQYAGIAGEITSSGSGLNPPSGALLFYTATGIPPMGEPYSEQMRITHEGKVGIGTSSPQNKLDIDGALAIGSSYAGSSAAPSDGLIVEGNVGIGTTSPWEKLHVNNGGLYINHPGGSSDHGVYLESAGGHGYHVLTSGSHGFNVNNAGGHGLNITTASDNGINITTAGSCGIDALGLQGNHLRCEGSAYYGLYVHSLWDQSTSPGLYVYGTSYFTGNSQFAGNVGFGTPATNNRVEVNGIVSASRFIGDGIIGAEDEYVVFNTTHFIRGIITVTASSWTWYGDYMPYIPIPVPSGVEGIYVRLILSRDAGGHAYARLRYKETTYYSTATDVNTDSQTPVASPWVQLPPGTRLMTVECYKTGADCTIYGLVLEWAYKVD